MKIRHLMGGACLAMAMTTVSAVEVTELEAAYDAARQGYYQQAAQSFEPLADQGDARAQFNLGLMYHSGMGVGRDEARAVRFYHQAAANGYGPAQEYLQVGYQEGWFGLQPNEEQAAYWEQRRSEQH